MTTRTWLILTCAGLVAGSLALLLGRNEPVETHEGRDSAPSSSGAGGASNEANPIRQRAAAGASAPTPNLKPASVHDTQGPEPTREDILRDDDQLTARLAALRKRDPELALEMTRAVLEQAPNHPDVPERNWIVIRALVDLKRRDEAKSEARELVRRFPKSHWALDAERHLLVQP